jgi:hypothetical protein
MEAKQPLFVSGLHGIMPAAPLCVVPIPAMPNIDLGNNMYKLVSPPNFGH